jgi:parallel beta-helix repeat protein
VPRVDSKAVSRLAAIVGLALGALLLGGVPTASATTWHVAPDGNDTSVGSENAQFATISRAAEVARSGDTVLVASGRYRERILLSTRSSGVTFRGVGATRPIIDGEDQRAAGFASNGTVSVVTIANFEITRQTDIGIQISGKDNVVADNVIHHVGLTGPEHVFGVRVVYGDGGRIERNTIHDIGPGAEATGVHLTNSREVSVSRNVIYLIRKEGVRDWMGLDNQISGNRIFLTWAGIALNSSTGSLVDANYVYDSVHGIYPKHMSQPGVLSYWKLTAARWSRIESNTVYRSGDSSIVVASNAPISDYISVKENVFSGAGSSFIADEPRTRSSNVVFEDNTYSNSGGAPPWLYHVGYNWTTDGARDLPALRSMLGWELSGTFAPTSSPTELESRPVPASPATWRPYEMKPIHSTSPGTWYTKTHLGDASDGRHHTYWLSSTGENESVTFDLGVARPISHFVLDVYAHFDKRNVRGYRFEVSDDDRTYRTVLEGTNPDSAGSSYKYALPEIVTARYVRFVLVDTFCDSYAPRTGCGPYFVLSDLRAGLLTSVEVADPVPSTDPIVEPAPPVPAETPIPPKPSSPSPSPAPVPPKPSSPSPTPTPTTSRPATKAPATSAPKVLPAAPRATPAAPAAPVAPAPASAPVLTIARVNGVVGADGRVRLGLRCHGAASKVCRGSMTVTPAGGRRTTPTVTARKQVNLPAGSATKFVAVQLSRAVRGQLKARGALRLQVVVTNGSAAGVKRTLVVRSSRTGRH